MHLFPFCQVRSLCPEDSCGANLEIHLQAKPKLPRGDDAADFLGALPSGEFLRLLTQRALPAVYTCWAWSSSGFAFHRRGVCCAWCNSCRLRECHRSLCCANLLAAVGTMNKFPDVVLVWSRATAGNCAHYEIKLYASRFAVSGHLTSGLT